MLQESKIKVTVVNSDILHVLAFQKTVVSSVCFHRVSIIAEAGLLADISGETDLFLIGMDSSPCCIKWLVTGLLKRYPLIPVICYASDFSAARFQLGTAPHGVSVVSTEELLSQIADFSASLTRQDYQDAQPAERSDHEAVLHEHLKALSPRELDIFCLFAKGHGISEIAIEFGCCVSTVESHVKNLRSKLSAANSVDLRRVAVKIMQSGHCRAFATGHDHICDELNAPVGSCPFIRCV